MVYTSNCKLAEVEEELRTVVEEREALRSALRIVEGENDILRAKTSVRETTRDNKLPSLHTEDNEKSILQQDAVSANYLHLDKSSPLADPVSFITISPVDLDFSTSPCNLDAPVPSRAATELLLKHESPRYEALADLASRFPINSIPWNVMPQTPHSRMAVKNEFEKAMLRMERLIKDVEGSPHCSPIN